MGFKSFSNNEYVEFEDLKDTENNLIRCFDDRLNTQQRILASYIFKVDDKINNNYIKLDNRMNILEQKQDNMQLDINELKSDVSELKSDVSELKSDVSELKSDFS